MVALGWGLPKMPWPLLLLLPHLCAPQGVVQPEGLIPTTVPPPLFSPSPTCPDLLQRVFPSSLPFSSSNTSLVTYTPAGEATTLTSCVHACCSSTSCSAALLTTSTNTSTCTLVSCSSDTSCQPSPQPPGQPLYSMVLVRPHTPPWDLPSPSSSLPPTTPSAHVCEVGTAGCPEGETCVPLQDKSRNGLCRCPPGQPRDPRTDKCRPAAPAPTLPPPIAISVAVSSKEVQLPAAGASLTAYTVPTDDSLQYEWKLLSSPSSGATSAIEKGRNEQSLHLSGLVEGVYVWKVVVTSAQPPGYGEARANVTVLAARRINSPPKAVIVPTSQTVNLPTNKAVVDGAGSIDDSGALASYAWVLDSGPVGYQPDLPALPTLSLTNLTAGNYTLRLTVTDVDGATDSTTAGLVVVPDTDYKPKANAGEDKIIFLPINTVMLNGNMSSDDHGIKTFEWTKEKGADGKELPADISGARSAYVTASNLEQGTYNFLLRVTDEAGQSGEDRVAVYVKPPTNLPPVARAGPKRTLSLPLESVLLDGSKSSDDGHITSFLWSVDSSPPARAPSISNTSAAVTNVTSLTEGSYVFRLTVTDNSGNNHSATTALEVQHDRNTGPVAVAGKDQRVILPRTSITLDGRGSRDDLGVERWRWVRGADSPAAGTLVGGNTSSPVITVTDLVPGTYTWHLTVWDRSDEQDTKAVRVTVIRDPDILSEVEIVLNKDLMKLTEKDKDAVVRRVEVMTRAAGTLTVEHVAVLGDILTQQATIRFKVFAEEGGVRKALAGRDVVRQLRRELAADSELLSQPVVAVRTRVCQNTCGGHGTCDQATRRCICQVCWNSWPT